MNCRQCGKELPANLRNDICLDCAKANLKKTLDADPALKQAFKETIEELRKPENIKKMADDATAFIGKIQQLRK
jgi:hypothetical protein